MAKQDPSKPVIKQKAIAAKTPEEKAKEQAEAEKHARQREGMARSKAEDDEAMKADYQKVVEKRAKQNDEDEKVRAEKEKKQKEDRNEKARKKTGKGEAKHSISKPLGSK